MGKLGNSIEERSIQVQADWAIPLMTQGMAQVANSGLLMPGSNAGRINLMGNSNYFRIKGDSLFISLPYFGERQMGGGYGNSNVGINYEGKPFSFEVRPEKDRYILEIDVKDQLEVYRFNLFLFPSGKADINVNSSHRTSIRYSGQIIPNEDSKSQR